MSLTELCLIGDLSINVTFDALGVFADHLSFWLGLTRLDAALPVVVFGYRDRKPRCKLIALLVLPAPLHNLNAAHLALKAMPEVLKSIRWLTGGQAVRCCSTLYRTMG